jgi:hypothetical protein
MVDTETGEFTEMTLSHEGNEVREFYTALEGPVVVGIEATGAMQWFLELLEALGSVPGGSSGEDKGVCPTEYVPTVAPLLANNLVTVLSPMFTTQNLLCRLGALPLGLSKAGRSPFVYYQSLTL